MTLERILKAAVSSMIKGHHAPRCYSAHVVGRGYVNNGSAPFDRVDYLRQLERDAMSEVENIGYATEYAEPGYTQPERGIVLANWNQFPNGLDDVLERAGYAIEWSDEWSTCDGCGRLVRTSGNSYSWTQSYVLYNECSIVCADCVRADLDEYERHLLNNANIADTLDIDWADRGFIRMNADHYENGFHPRQNDWPQDIAKHVPTGYDYLFAIARVQQFDMAFDCWIRSEETAND